jgi:hypothetical protein
MNVADLIAALDLPAECRVDQRVPKKLLVENGAPTAADMHRINDGIEEIHWLAALKPTTIGVPEYRDEAREYLEIAVLSVILRPGAKEARLAELIHRAVPYPVFLVTAAHDQPLNISLAHKRWAQNEANKVVLEDEIVSVNVAAPPLPIALEQTFLASLSLGRQSRPHLFALYQGWLDAILAVQAASITGTFTPTASIEDSLARRTALQQVQQLEAQIVALRKTAAKERQMARQVELNLEVQRIEAELAVTRKML